MDVSTTAVSQPRWRRKKTYLWTLAAIGILHGLLTVFGQAHPPIKAGVELFIGFSLNVALLGWCYADAEERMVAISGFLGFVMLFIAAIGIPWYFVRSRGLVGGLKGALGFGLFGIWFAFGIVGVFVGVIAIAIII